MKRWKFFVRHMSKKESATTLALFRISVGFVIVITLAWLLYLGIDQIVWIDDNYGGYRNLGKGNWLLKRLGGTTPDAVRLLCIGNLLGGICVMFGIGGRLAIFATLQMYMAMHRINGEASGSSDIVITNALWLLFLADSCATLSIDAFIRTGRVVTGARIHAWPRYLAILLLVVMYTTTGMQKISAYWTPPQFSALHYILQQPSWNRFDNTWILHFPWLTRFATGLTWVWEWTAWILVVAAYLRATKDRGGRLRRFFTRFDVRIPFAAIGLGFHLNIMLLMVVGPFSPISMTYYWCLFSGNEWDRAFTRAKEKWQSRGTGNNLAAGAES